MSLRQHTYLFSDPHFSRQEVETFLRRWLTTTEASGGSEGTTRFRTMFIRQFLWWMDDTGRTDFTPETLEDYIAYLRTAHKSASGRWGDPDKKTALRPQTVWNYFRDFRAWGNWLVKRRICEYSPCIDLDAPRFLEEKIEPFSETQVNDLLKAAKQSRAPQRDRAILLFMLDTGIRCTELCSIQYKDLDLDERQIKVLGKGNKYRILPFSPRTSDALFSYLVADAVTDEHQYLFRAERGGNPNIALQRNAILMIYHRLGALAGIEQTRCSPHTMRHTFAIFFLRAGGSIETLQQLLGHTDLSMTMRYVKVAAADIREQHRRHSPVEALLNKKR